MGYSIDLATFIQAKMKEQNLSAADVARRAGNELSPTTIIKIVNGEVSKSGAKTLALIAKGLGESAIDLFRVAIGEDVSRPLWQSVYAERFGADDIEPTEWQFLESYFVQHVDRLRSSKKERQALIDKMIQESKVNKVVAKIEPGEKSPTREDAESLVRRDMETETKKRKAG